MNGRCYLKKSADFSLVHVKGSWLGSRILNVKYIGNNLGYTRVGIIASKKVGNAVTRNHTKRQIREIIRSLNVKQGYDIVIVSRQQITTVDYDYIYHTIKTLFIKGSLLDIY